MGEGCCALGRKEGGERKEMGPWSGSREESYQGEDASEEGGIVTKEGGRGRR